MSSGSQAHQNSQAKHPQVMAAATPGMMYKYLEVTDLDLSLLLAALEQVSDQNNCHAQASRIQLLLDRISYSLSSSPSSYLCHPNHYGQPYLACANGTTRGE
jgi:hypothetical protein